MGHLITLATYVRCTRPDYVSLMVELIYHPAGQSFGHYLKLDLQPTDLSQLAKPMGSGLPGPRLSRPSSIRSKGR